MNKLSSGNPRESLLYFRVKQGPAHDNLPPGMGSNRSRKSSWLVERNMFV